MEYMVTMPQVAPRAASLTDVVRERRSIRLFCDHPVSRELVEHLLRQALWAPSPHNAQPWRFTVLFSCEDKSKLADTMGAQLTRELESDGLPSVVIEQQVERSRCRISSAPVVVLCSLTREGLVEYPDRRRNDLELQMAVQSVGAVLQTLFLLAAAHGLGSCWMAAPMYCPQVVRDVLGLADGVEPQALVLLGYPSAPGKVRERRPFEEVVDLR
jgi:F420 biosynthesis protein FbiB-like protein